MSRFAEAVTPDPQSIGHHLQLKAAHVKIPQAIGVYGDGTLI